MVTAQTILIVLAIGAFVLAGGVGISKQAFAQFKTDFETVKVGLTEQVKNIRAKTEAGETGESVG